MSITKKRLKSTAPDMRAVGHWQAGIRRVTVITTLSLLAACATVVEPPPEVAASASAASETIVEPLQLVIVNFGEARSRFSGEHVDAPTTTTGALRKYDDLEIIRNATFDIPARLGAEMAVEYYIDGGSVDTTVLIEMRTIHPPLLNPKTGRVTQVSRWQATVRKRTLETRSYAFEYDWEVAPGEWTFEFWHDGRFLAQQVFNVRAVSEND